MKDAEHWSDRAPAMGRAFAIAAAFGGFVIWLAWRRMPWARRSQSVGERFAELLQRLGTTFIKLGQHLSLRADLLPDETLHALARLQDHVLPFPVEVAEREIQQAFGQRVEQLFSRFDRVPLAAASVAQIHRAALPDGREVVVKVRRPGILSQVDSDMRLLRQVARVAQWLIPPVRRFGPVAMVDEIWANLRLELDLAREARYVRRFADAFRGSATVTVPDVIGDLWTQTVFIQEFSQGRRIDTLSGEPGLAVAQSLVDSYLHQLFRMGLFHGDPHPGNLFVMSDLRVCFHDFGIVGHLDKRLRRALAAFATAFVEQDADWVVDAWLDLGLLRQQTDRQMFRGVVEDILRDCAERPLREWSLAQAFMRLVAAGRSSAIGLPTSLLVLSRMLLLLESTVRQIAPAFSIFETLSKHVESGPLGDSKQHAAPSSRRLPFELAAAMDELPQFVARQLHGRLGKARLFELAIVPDPSFAQTLAQTGDRIALALVTLGLYIASSLLMQHAIGPKVAGLPMLAIAGYALAIRFTFSVAWGRPRGYAR